MTIELVGDKRIAQILHALGTKVSQRALAAGLRAEMSPISKAMRSEINSSSASPAVKRAARKAVGQRFLRARRKREMAAKVGYAVGKKGNVILSERKSHSVETSWQGGVMRIASVRRKGVGISTSNIHWFILGTKQRLTKKGRRTGKIHVRMGGVVARAVSSAAGAAQQQARQKIWQTIEREARKGK